MSRKQLGFLALLLGLALIIGGTLFAVGGIMGALKGFAPIATVASPESVEFTITEPDTYTLWHDHQTMHNGSFVSVPTELPPGFTFTLEDTATNTALPMAPLHTEQTLSINARQSVGVGTFLLTVPGTYRLSATNTSPPAEELPGSVTADPAIRVFSLSKGNFMNRIGSTVGRGLLAAALALLGFVLAISGILMLTLGRKKNSPPSLSLS